MDYSKLSDFDINCEVLAVFSPDIKHMCLGADNTCFYDCGPIGDGWYQIDIPDYCNSPADAWPIIAENKISIYAAILGDSRGEWGAESSSTDYYHFHNNALRAAMIVFLKMQESANVPANSTGSDIR